MAKPLSKKQQDDLLVDEVWKEITYECPTRGTVVEMVKVKKYAAVGTETIRENKLVSEFADALEKE